MNITKFKLYFLIDILFKLSSEFNASSLLCGSAQNMGLNFADQTKVEGVFMKHSNIGRLVGLFITLQAAVVTISATADADQKASSPTRGESGGGGDGLILESPPTKTTQSNSGTVIVPVPDVLQPTATIEIQAEPGVIKTSSSFDYCLLDDQNSNNCKRRGKAPVNTPLSSLPGTYLIWYMGDALKDSTGNTEIILKSNQRFVIHIDYGTVEIDGVAGKGQRAYADFNRCETPDNGWSYQCGYNHDHFGVLHDYFGTNDLYSDEPVSAIPLNSQVKLPVGNYFICYSFTCEVVAIHKGESQVLKLSKIEVPAMGGTYEFTVIHDYSDPQEITRVIYRNNSDADKLDKAQLDICQRAPRRDLNWDADAIAYCQNLKQSLQEKNYLKYATTIYHVTNDDTIERMQVVCDDTRVSGHAIQKCSLARLDLGQIAMGADPSYDYAKTYVADPADGQFVSVFPGTYKLSFKNAQGDISETPHVHVYPQ
jgi:hypothetical protein